MATTRWALITYGHYWLANVLHIFITTNVPINLAVIYTDNQPVYYPTGKIVRGEEFLADPHYRFVDATEIPQAEPGDTLNHTFTIPGWRQGLKRWWYFDGTIGGMPTISNTGYIHAQAYDQQEAFSMRHLDLTDKEAAGIIDHADGSITPAKLVSPFNFTAIPLVPPAWPTQDFELTSKEYVDLTHNDHKWQGTWDSVVFVPSIVATTGWVEIDLSGEIPILTSLVHLSLYMSIFSIGATGDVQLRVRNPNLTTDEDYIPALRLAYILGHRNGDEQAMQYTVGPSPTRKLQYRVKIVGVIGITLHIKLQAYTYSPIP